MELRRIDDIHRNVPTAIAETMRDLDAEAMRESKEFRKRRKKKT
jgi:hypothetical protein